MKDKMREPNSDPNSCTDIDLVGFKYLNYVPSENKAEWVKEQMSDPRRVAVLVQTCYQENAFARKLPEIDEEDLCRRFLSRAYDKIKPNI